MSAEYCEVTARACNVTPFFRVGVAQQNHIVISQNLANVNTPDYKTKELSFEKLLESSALSETGSDSEYPVEDAKDLPERADGNNVDLEREIAGLKKNSMVHQTLVQILGSKIGIMNRAING